MQQQKRYCIRCGRKIVDRLNGVKSVGEVHCICKYCSNEGYFYCNKMNKPCHCSISQDCKNSGCNNSSIYDKFLRYLIS